MLLGDARGHDSTGAVRAASVANAQRSVPPGQPVGGFSLAQPPVSFLLYRVRPGDTITGIAQKLGLNPDTISSLNRSEGRGVHSLSVGEQIRIPTQDGIFVTLDSDFDALCRKKGVSPEEVLAANAVTREPDRARPAAVFPRRSTHGLRVQPLPGRRGFQPAAQRVGDFALRLPLGPLHRSSGENTTESTSPLLTARR